MRLSWNEIRVRAANFARAWADQGYERGQTQLFYKDFFEIFDVPVKRVATFEKPVKGLGDRRGFIDLFWKGVLLVEQKSAGRDLRKAKTQALNYFPALTDAELPRFLLLSDFRSFELYDLKEDEECKFQLADLPDQIDKFGFVSGIRKRSFKDQDPVNIKASELVGKLHDTLDRSGYRGHDLERFLVRTVFCLFADDTGIFEPRGIFLDLIENRTREDGSDLGGWLEQLFETLATPENERLTTLDEDLSSFAYINGDLFRDRLRTTSFTAEMRRRLITACRFDWSKISPAIFGSLFQYVMNREERRAQGAHYTTEKNILKVIKPLFLDNLRAEFERLRLRKDSGRWAALKHFHQRLARMKFLDPACGCGNFLIIVYRELRLLDIDLIRERRSRSVAEEQQELDATDLSLMNVDQFHGIEIGEFPVRIAEAALWMMDHIMNNRLAVEFGQNFIRIPLRRSPHIRQGDALEMDWREVLPPDECSFVLGNPPFVGAKYQTPEQRGQVRRTAVLGGSGGTLDYVSAWFIKAGEYITKPHTRIGFVATNSITQGEQVAQLWPILFDRCGLEIAFAHRTFAWGSDARGKAHVHVVVIGLAKSADAPKSRRLFSYEDLGGEPHETLHSAITPYLFDVGKLSDPHLLVREVARPLNGLPPLKFGSMPNDGGGLILNTDERDRIISENPSLSLAIRKLIGAKDFLNGRVRYCLWLEGIAPEEIRKSPYTLERIGIVRKHREKSRRAATRELAKYPGRFGEIRHTGDPYILIPRVGSAKREYLPIGYFDGQEIAADSCLCAPGASLSMFALLNSAMHMAWLRYMGGRLKSDPRYSIGIVYNTFPAPGNIDRSKTVLERSARAILDERNKNPGSTLADLYDPDSMPTGLRKAHENLDRVVDRLYRRSRFESERERIEHLFEMYERMLVPLAPKSSRRRRRPRG